MFVWIDVVVVLQVGAHLIVGVLGVALAEGGRRERRRQGVRLDIPRDMGNLASGAGERQGRK